MEWAAMFPTAEECARHLWEQGQVIEVASFDEVCEWAVDDPEAYDHLMNWAKAQGDLSVETKARLFDILVQGRPRKGKARTAYRNKRLRAIAKVLVEHYNLPLVQNMPGGGVRCTAAVLAALPDAPSEGTIANALTASRA